MMTCKRILVALSLTDGRDAAFERALTLARHSGAELYLLHAIPDKRPFSHRAVERLQRAAALRERPAAAGVIAQTFEQHGDPAEIIVLHADDRQVDLIVMGTEPRSLWGRLRQRSVAERVLRGTPRPTLIVRSDDTGDGTPFERVLAAVDLTPASAAVIDTATQWSGRDRRLTLLHAVTGIEAAGDVHNPARWMVPEYRRHLLRDARRRLKEITSRHDGDVTIRLRGAAGPAADAIAAHADDVDADLVVMGRSQRLLHLGSTVVRVLRHIDRSLLIVPPAASRQLEGGPRVHPRAA